MNTATAPASYDAPAIINNPPLAPELRAQVAEEQVQYLLEVFAATQSRLQSLVEKTMEASAQSLPREKRRTLAQFAGQLKTLSEELAEARQTLNEHTAPIIHARKCE